MWTRMTVFMLNNSEIHKTKVRAEALASARVDASWRL